MASGRLPYRSDALQSSSALFSWENRGQTTFIRVSSHATATEFLGGMINATQRTGGHSGPHHSARQQSGLPPSQRRRSSGVGRRCIGRSVHGLRCRWRIETVWCLGNRRSRPRGHDVCRRYEYMDHTSREALVRFWRVVELAAFMLAAAAFVAAIAHGQYYLRYAPTYPQPEIGRVNPYREHGSVVYITKHELVVMNSFFVAAFVGAGIFLLLRCISIRFQNADNERSNLFRIACHGWVWLEEGLERPRAHRSEMRSRHVRGCGHRWHRWCNNGCHVWGQGRSSWGALCGCWPWFAMRCESRIRVGAADAAAFGSGCGCH
jgi:hypothetical protein